VLKRIYSLALCVTLIFSLLVACDGEAPLNEPTPSPTPSAPPPSPSPEPISSEDEDIYYEFMQSGEWKGDEVWLDEGNLEGQGIEITAYKIFDFDGDGVKELWLEAYDNEFRRHAYSAFYKIEDGQVKRLLYGVLSGGSMGGDWVTVRYDTYTEKHLLSLIGSFGGFGGRSSTGKYYEYENGELNEAFSMLTMYQTAKNYREEDLEGLYYVDEDDDREPEWRTITIYEIDDERVTKEAFEQMRERLIEPIDDTFILRAG